MWKPSSRKVIAYRGHRWVRFPISILEFAGLLVPPFDRHGPAGQDQELTSITRDEWRLWTNRLLDSLFVKHVQGNTRLNVGAADWPGPPIRLGRDWVGFDRIVAHRPQAAGGPWGGDPGVSEIMDPSEAWPGSEEVRRRLSALWSQGTDDWEEVRRRLSALWSQGADDWEEEGLLPGYEGPMLGDVWGEIFTRAREQTVPSDIVIFYLLSYSATTAYVRPPGSIVLTLGQPPPSDDLLLATASEALSALTLMRE